MMKSVLFVFILALSISKFAFAFPEINYSQASRIQSLQSSFEAFQSLENSFINNTQQLLRSQNRYACSAQAEQLRIQCLIEQANLNCQSAKKKQQEACGLISDIIVTNLIEQNSFLDQEAIFKIMKNVRGSRDQLQSALSGRYARLASEFLIFNKNSCQSRDINCLSSSIDKFCLKKANQKKMSWQGCAAGVVWFIGSNFK